MPEPTDPTPRNASQAALLALAVASGSTVRSAAVRLGISERTAKRWGATARFKKKVESLRAELLSTTVGRLASESIEAVETLGRIMRDPLSADTLKMSCAKAILDKLPLLHEHFELSARVKALESRAEETRGSDRW
jgi:hypothetical protein